MTFQSPFRAARRQRQALSSPECFPHSPVDSGYGSAPATPPTPTPTRLGPRSICPTRGLWMLGDGNRSDSDDPFRKSEDEQSPDNTFAILSTPRTTPGTEATSAEITQGVKKHLTLPIRSARTRPSLPSSFRSESGTRLPRRSSNIGLTRSGTGSLRLPDRFIPSRSNSFDTAEKFKTGKAPHELTRSEKLLRHNGAAEDAFCFRRRVVTPMAANYRIQSLSETGTSRNRVGSVLGPLDQNSGDGLARQVSNGTVWTVGGVVPGGTAINNGRGQLVRSGTNARLFRTSFPAARPKAEEELEKHEARIATALGLDRAKRVLEMNATPPAENSPAKHRDSRTQWNGTEWVKEGSPPKPQKPVENRQLPISPFKVLDAPNLRDDFYCSILAYSPTCRTLAVGLGDLLYGWSELKGVQLLNAGSQQDRDCHLTSVAFSSSEGSKCILAFGRSNKTLGLMSLYDDPEHPSSRSGPMPRFEVLQPAPVACLSWKPTCTIRPSESPLNPGTPVNTEDLLVGDDTGLVYYYAVEWPDRWEVERNNWAGKMTLLARISVHSQQICGLAWSRTGDLFATGGNDNRCCLFETDKVLEFYTEGPVERHEEDSNEGITAEQAEPRVPQPDPERLETFSTDADTEIQIPLRPAHVVKDIKLGDEKHRWTHGAAVKAIAFCPWQEGLVATGGGSNDKCIHFFHTTSGAALATISVSAQVTSLIWSTTRREIAATFGYAQPEHPVRIAVFSWPDCRQVAAIPWAGEHRALYAIPYPGGPEGGRSTRNGGRTRNHGRTSMEGCIMVASSDKSVKFHEVWAADRKATAGSVGMLGGSDILESLEGIDREGAVIR
ncbi:WD40-repeat-containing domain protein [Lasiosphaeris hirsuta]|uniref:WD40-repeat-containing domain protein n=1 Tax=Lasiosphaeris hirsuta TaxID=260670 RepID=A0AA39ZWE7_9PEZI|nr:WD40-repeat-containing domain protein [Lasiosphaeris hirsuta]